MEKFKIGKVVNSVALKGEIKIYNYSDYKERYEEIEKLLIGETLYKIQKVRYQKEMVIVKLEGIDDRNAADELKNEDIFIYEDELRELPEDVHYIKDLIGLSVIDKKDGTKLGEIVDVLQNSAQDIYVVKREGKEDLLIPVVSEFVKEISLEDKTVNVELIEGFLE